MLAHLRCFVKSITNQTTKYAKLTKNSKLIWCNNQFYSNNSTPSDFEIVDVNIDKMINEDDEFTSNYNYEPEPQQIMPSGGGGVAPVDIDAWIDEELWKAGTVDMECVEKFREEIHYPEPPKERTGYYEFEGIKIWLAKKMLTPATYRYRLEEGEEESLPDDIRICKFEKFKPSP